MNLKKKTHYRRDQKRRLAYNKHEIDRKLYKAIFFACKIPISVRYESFSKLQKAPKDSSLSRQRNRCIETLRPRGILSKYGLSRLRFRELAQKGLIPGVEKASF